MRFITWTLVIIKLECQTLEIFQIPKLKYSLLINNDIKYIIIDMLKEINIAYVFDKNYLYPAAVSTNSCILSTQSKLNIFWVIPDEDFQLVEQFLKKILSHIKIKLITFNMDKFNGMLSNYHFSKSMYLKLTLQDLIKVDKIIYLDADTIILNDLYDFFSNDLGNNLIGGVQDLEGSKTTRIQRDKDDIYINSGVMLLNLKLLKKKNFLNFSLEIYKNNKDKILWPDQDIINKFSENKKIIFHEQYNKQIFSNRITQIKFQEIIKEKNSILHFVGGIKPWQKWCNVSIFNYYQTYIKKIPNINFNIAEILDIGQAKAFSDWLELDGQLLEACKIKNNIIENLFKHIKAFN